MAATLMEDPHELSSEFFDIVPCTSHAVSTLGLAGDRAFHLTLSGCH